MENFIRQNYPHAEKGLELTRDCVETLVSRHGFDLKKTLLATSVCSDEIIRSATNFREYLDSENPFQLGGLAGFPFAGLTGLQAFAGHIPDDGFAIIQYGPHIGVSKNGEIGKMKRLGQILESSCCGALQATLKDFEASRKPAADSDLDYQLWKIENSLVSNCEFILSHSIPLVAVTDCMFNVIQQRIEMLVKTSANSWNGIKVALIGGIIINTDHNLPDWFDLRQFDVVEY